MSIAAVVLETSDYDRFELNGFNRALRQNKHLEESMLSHGFLSHKPLAAG